MTRRIIKGNSPNISQKADSLDETITRYLNQKKSLYPIRINKTTFVFMLRKKKQ